MIPNRLILLKRLSKAFLNRTAKFSSLIFDIFGCTLSTVDFKVGVVFPLVSLVNFLAHLAYSKTFDWRLVLLIRKFFLFFEHDFLFLGDNPLLWLVDVNLSDKLCIVL